MRELFRVSAAAKSLNLDSSLHTAKRQPLATEAQKAKRNPNNLLTNVNEFTSQGEVQLVVEPDTQGKRRPFYETDTGSGLATELQAPSL